MNYTREQIEKAVKSNGYVYFNSSTDYDVNIIGIRNSAPKNAVTNIFDDWITISFKVDGVWIYRQYQITTDAGTKAVKEFHNPNGVARLIPNQYRGAYAIGLHQGKYEALKQMKPVSVWRDKNKDMTFDQVVVDTGLFGINIHRSNPKTQSEYVENWSEGCQVFKRVKDFNEFMSVCNKAKQIHGNTFSYTLIESKDIV